MGSEQYIRSEAHEGYFINSFQRLILEEALTAGRRATREWYTEMVRNLTSHGRAKASQRLAEVFNEAEANSEGLWAAEEAYLRHYFYKEHAGMGLPTLEAPGAYRKAIGVLNRPITAADAKANALQLQLEQASLLKVRSRDVAHQAQPGAGAFGSTRR